MQQQRKDKGRAKVKAKVRARDNCRLDKDISIVREVGKILVFRDGWTS